MSAKTAAEELANISQKTATENLTLQHIIELREAFEAADKDGGGSLSLEEFVEAFGGVLGKGMTEKQMKQLFMKIDANSDGSVDWDEFMNFMLLENQSLDTMTVENVNYDLNIKPDPSIASEKKNTHGDMITKVISVVEEVGPERKKLHKYITGGRDGYLKMWNASNLEVLQSIPIVRKAWITAICYMRRSGVVAVGAGDRTLTFIELSTGQAVSKITMQDGMPLCMSYFYSFNQGKEILAVGDDLGILHIYVMKSKWHMCDLQTLKEKCLSCHASELEAKRNKMMNEAFSTKKGLSVKKGGIDKSGFQFQHIENVTIKEMLIHEGWITRVLIVDDLDAIITCSLDGKIHFHGIEDYKYKRTCKLHEKGINALIWSRASRFLASCGEERQIIVWNAFTLTSMAVLTGHLAPVQELGVNEEKQHLFSLSADKVVKIWNIKTYQCLQTIEVSIRFRPENMITCMTYDDIKRVLLLGTRKLNIAYFRASTETETSHDSPISVILYNSTFEVVVSCDENSTVCIWDIETSKMIFRFAKAHDNQKITAACFDDMERRLITSSHSGDIKIWNFSNGQCLTEMMSPKSMEVTCLLLIKPKLSSTQLPSIISNGWSRMACVWPDIKEEKVEVSRTIPPVEMEGSLKHGGDVTCMIHSMVQNILVTGASDGTLVGWIFETGYPKFLFHEIDPSCLTKKVASIEESVEFIGFIDGDKFLVSGTANQIIRIWDLSDGSLVEKLSAEHGDQEIITTGKIEKNCMVTGDNRGNLKCWEIKEHSLISKWFISAHKDGVTTIEICDHGGEKFILSGGMDKNILLHSKDGLHISTMGSKLSKCLSDFLPEKKKMVPPRKEIKFTSERYEEPRSLKEESKDRKKGFPYQSNKNKFLLKYVAPYKQVDLTKFSIPKIPNNYKDLI